jgi:hypothetical protein
MKVFAFADNCGIDAARESFLISRDTPNGCQLIDCAINASNSTEPLALPGRHVLKIEWTGEPGKFVTEVCPSTIDPKKGGVSALFYVERNVSSKLTVTQFNIPEGARLLLGAYTWQSSKARGLFAITASYSNPERNLAKAIANDKVNNSQYFFVVYRNFLPWISFPTPKLYLGYPIAFSSGEMELAATIPKDSMGSRLVSVDMLKGAVHDFQWISSDLTLSPHFRGDFKEALVLFERPAPNGLIADSIRETVDSLTGQADEWAKQHAMTSAPKAILAAFGANHPAKVVAAFASFPDLAIDAEDKYFWVSDGINLWKVADASIMEQKKLPSTGQN